jgi:hypothetical protein
MSALDPATDEEEFHSSFRIFLNAIEMLASSPEEQCRLMGNYNVAWELKEDVQAGKYLVGRGYLTPNEEAWVKALVAALDPIDTQVLPSGSDTEANVTAMSHPYWVPARFLAAEVLRRLAASAAANAKYLQLPQSAA